MGLERRERAPLLRRVQLVTRGRLEVSSACAVFKAGHCEVSLTVASEESRHHCPGGLLIG
jgi:hypothetical protein